MCNQLTHKKKYRITSYSRIFFCLQDLVRNRNVTKTEYMMSPKGHGNRKKTWNCRGVMICDILCWRVFKEHSYAFKMALWDKDIFVVTVFKTVHYTPFFFLKNNVISYSFSKTFLISFFIRFGKNDYHLWRCWKCFGISEGQIDLEFQNE